MATVNFHTQHGEFDYIHALIPCVSSCMSTLFSPSRTPDTFAVHFVLLILVTSPVSVPAPVTLPLVTSQSLSGGGAGTKRRFPSPSDASPSSCPLSSPCSSSEATAIGSACDRCRIGKRKCDRNRPCGRCIRIGLASECVEVKHEPAEGGRRVKPKIEAHSPSHSHGPAHAQAQVQAQALRSHERPGSGYYTRAALSVQTRTHTFSHTQACKSSRNEDGSCCFRAS